MDSIHHLNLGGETSGRVKKIFPPSTPLCEPLWSTGQ